MKYSVGSQTCSEVPTLTLLNNNRQTNPMFSQSLVSDCEDSRALEYKSLAALNT